MRSGWGEIDGFREDRIKMKDFFQRYSYQSVRLLLNQVAIGIFGFVLALVAAKMEPEGVRTAALLGVGCFATLFFLFLQFASTWKGGAEDRVSIDLGKRKKDALVPLKIWLLANSVSLLLAFLISLGLWFNVEFLGNVGYVAQLIKYIIDGMYLSLLAVKVGGVPLHDFWFMHFLTTLPALAVIYASYFCGLNNINFGGLFSSKNT